MRPFRPMFRLLFTLLVSLMISVAKAGSMTPQDAVRAMNAFPFDRSVFQSSLAALTSAARHDPDNPWVYIGFARASLVQGYSAGSWFKMSSFDARAIEHAERFLIKAIELDEGISRAHAELARIRMIQGEYEEAWSVLNRAHVLDRESFYAWHYMSVLHYYYRLYDKALSLAGRARGEASETFQLRWVLQQERRVARAQGDLVAVEESYRREMELDPLRPQTRGNYALFLKGQGRLDEAKRYYEEALALGEYPLARQQYEELLERMAKFR